MNNKGFKSWEKTRSKGKKNFIIYRGVLCWGMPMFVLMTLFVNKPGADGYTFLFVLGNALLWTMGGAFWGILTWNLIESRYVKEIIRRKEMSKSGDSSQDVQ